MPPIRNRNRNRNRKQWFTHGYFRTYQIAGRISRIAGNPFAYLQQLEDFTMDNAVLAFLPNWQKETVVHKFAKWIADDIFIEDTSGPYIVEDVMGQDGDFSRRRYLPVDLAIRAYGISDYEPFVVPPPDGEMVKVEKNISKWVESSVVADACYEYFMEEIRLSEVYDNLLSQIADEVFYTMFFNRVALGDLNGCIARYISDLDPDEMGEFPEIAALLDRPGQLKRASPPPWARRAVFFRDHGLCAICGTDLSGLLDALPNEQFDHIIPLARGGLNDVTNLQLLCQPCNNKKSDKSLRPSSQYRRLYTL